MLCLNGDAYLRSGFMFTSDPELLDLEVLVVPETTLILFAAIVEPLRAANRVAGRLLYRWQASSIDGQPAETATGVPIPVNGPFRAEGTLPLIVTGSYRIHAYLADPVIQALSRAGRHRPMIGGVEAGAWMLAHAGLLNGQAATTHWEDLNAFAARFPDIRVEEQPSLRSRTRFTTAGAGPTLDLMLDLIAMRQGRALALEVSRLMNFLPRAAASRRDPGLDPVVAGVVEVMTRNLDDPIPISVLAHDAGLSARHLQARFQQALGRAPYAHYLNLRLEEARRLLRETPLPVVEVAAATGFASPAGFTRAYRRRNAETPSDTRRLTQG